MAYFVGLDVSVLETAVCVVDEDRQGNLQAEGSVRAGRHRHAADVDWGVLDISLADAEVYEVADLVRNRGACLVFCTAADARHLPERFRDAPVVQKPASGKQIYSAVLRAYTPTAE